MLGVAYSRLDFKSQDRSRLEVSLSMQTSEKVRGFTA